MTMHLSPKTQAVFFFRGKNAVLYSLCHRIILKLLPFFLNGITLHVHHLNNTGMMKEPVRGLVTHTVTYKNKSTFLGHVFSIINTHWSSCQLVALRFSTLET